MKISVIGTGYLEHMVRQAVATWFPSLDVTFVTNKDFRSTNNAYSTRSLSLATVGTTAPDFRLRRTSDQTLALSSLRGRPVILLFYLADWHPVCTDQLALYQDFLPEKLLA